LTALQALKREGVEHVASAELALRIGCSGALVRKDLSSIGQWGRRSAGYSVELLSNNLRAAGGLDIPRRAAWLGCERLAAEPRLIEDFADMGCIIAGVFCDEGKEPGAPLPAGLVVRPVSDLPQAARELDLKLAVIAVDDERAQAAAELAASAGLRSILNLTDRVLVQPRGTTVENVSPLRGLVSLLLRAPTPFAGKPRRRRPS
jgi:redox-sensing transcriptional repressor